MIWNLHASKITVGDLYGSQSSCIDKKVTSKLEKRWRQTYTACSLPRALQFLYGRHFKNPFNIAFPDTLYSKHHNQPGARPSVRARSRLCAPYHLARFEIQRVQSAALLGIKRQPKALRRFWIRHAAEPTSQHRGRSPHRRSGHPTPSPIGCHPTGRLHRPGSAIGFCLFDPGPPHAPCPISARSPAPAFPRPSRTSMGGCPKS